MVSGDFDQSKHVPLHFYIAKFMFLLINDSKVYLKLPILTIRGHYPKRFIRAFEGNAPSILPFSTYHILLH